MTQLNHAYLPVKAEFTRTARREETNYGLFVALSIITIWAVSTVFLVSLNVETLPAYLIVLAMLWQMFLYTGLFVTTHDAIHGVLFPKNLKVNNLVGSFSAFVYALFSFEELSEKHWQHHGHPASELDPDFHDGTHKNFFAWYWRFTKKYWSWTRILGLVTIFHLMNYVLHIPALNLTLFWVIPPISSSVQLFYFGSFLPHQEPKGGYTNSHRAQSNELPLFLSFITCYHFGYHEEHHEYPHVPWWKLPEVYKLNRGIS